MNRFQTRPTLFETAEDAIFWAYGVQIAARDGAQLMTNNNVTRPCQYIDVLMVLDRAWRNHQISPQQYLTVKIYGLRGSTPEKRGYADKACRNWELALPVLARLMEAKGFVTPSVPVLARLMEAKGFVTPSVPATARVHVNRMEIR